MVCVLIWRSSAFGNGGMAYGDLLNTYRMDNSRRNFAENVILPYPFLSSYACMKQVRHALRPDYTGCTTNMVNFPCADGNISFIVKKGIMSRNKCLFGRNSVIHLTRIMQTFYLESSGFSVQ